MWIFIFISFHELRRNGYKIDEPELVAPFSWKLPPKILCKWTSSSLVAPLMWTFGSLLLSHSIWTCVQWFRSIKRRISRWDVIEVVSYRYPTSYPSISSLWSFESFFSFMESVVEYAGCDRISASKNSKADSDTSRLGETVWSVEWVDWFIFSLSLTLILE